jgi:hypothetical protein
MILEPNDYFALTVTATSVIVTGSGILSGVTLTPAAAASVVQLFDPLNPGVMTTTGASLILELHAVANGSSISCPTDASGIRFQNGLVAVVTGTGAQAFTQHKHLF